MSTEPTARPRKRLKWWMIVLVIVGLLLVGLVIASRYGTSQLQQAIAQTDQSDPGWTLEQLRQKQKVVSDEENSWLVAERVLKTLPKNWEAASGEPGQSISVNDLLALSDKKPRYERLTADEKKALDQILAKLKSEVPQARELANRPQGRPKFVYNTMVQLFDLEPLMQLRSVSRLLSLDLAQRVEDGDIDGALESARAMINTGRAIGDEPLMMAQLVRIGIVRSGLFGIEEALARGQASDSALMKTEELLKTELAQPVLLIGLRAERASAFDTYSGFLSGKYDPNQLAGGPAVPPSFLARLASTPSSVFIRSNLTATLEQMNQFVQIGKKPLLETPAEWKQLHYDRAAAFRKLSPWQGSFQSMAHLLMPSVTAYYQASLDHHLHIQSSRLMIALERERVATKTWPQDPVSLTPRLLPEFPWEIIKKEKFLTVQNDKEGWTITIKPVRESTSPSAPIKAHVYKLWETSLRNRPATPRSDTSVHK